MQYATALKTDRMTATRDRYQNGTLEIGTTGFAAILATFTFSATAGTVLSDIWTMAFTSNTVTGAAAGTAAVARIKRSAANGSAAEITGLTVGTSGADINLSNTNIAVGQNVTLTSASIQHAP